MISAVVFGNVTLDIICKTVDDVPRHESIPFEEVAIVPGGCGSNVAIGLSALGVPTTLVARVGADDAGELVRKYWERYHLDLRYLHSVQGKPTGTSVGLVDSDAQPRFIHTSGANATLTASALDLPALALEGALALHVAGYFVLPGAMDGTLADALVQAQRLGIFTSLDVVRSKRMQDPTSLWPLLPHLDVFLCNAHEGWRLTGKDEPEEAGEELRRRGAKNVIVKLGEKGCWLESESFSGIIGGLPVEVVDTTGAGDAFAAGLICAILHGNSLEEACRAGNAAGARVVSSLGAIGGWVMAGQ